MTFFFHFALEQIVKSEVVVGRFTAQWAKRKRLRP